MTDQPIAVNDETPPSNSSFSTKFWLASALLFMIPSFSMQIMIRLFSDVLRQNNDFLYVGSLFLNNLCSAVIPIILMYCIFKKDLKVSYKNSYRISIIDTILVFPLTIFIGSLADDISEFVSLLLQLLYGTPEISDPMSGLSPTSNLYGIVFFVSVVLIAPLTEEILFRGILLKASRQLGDLPAVLLNGLLFGLFHGNFYQTPYAIMSGILLAFVTVKSNSILPAFLMHFVNNLASTANAYKDKLPDGIVRSFYEIVGNVTAIIFNMSYFIGIFALFIFVARKLFDLDTKYKSFKEIFPPIPTLVFAFMTLLLFLNII